MCVFVYVDVCVCVHLCGEIAAPVGVGVGEKFAENSASLCAAADEYIQSLHESENGRTENHAKYFVVVGPLERFQTTDCIVNHLFRKLP